MKRGSISPERVLGFKLDRTRQLGAGLVATAPEESRNWDLFNHCLSICLVAEANASVNADIHESIT